MILLIFIVLLLHLVQVGSENHPLLQALQCRLCETVTLDGPISDCSCDFASVNKAVTKFYQPLLANLTSKTFFRYFRVDLERPCPFWHEDGQCVMEGCSVCTCEENEVPKSWIEEQASLLYYSSLGNGKGKDGKDDTNDDDDDGSLSAVAPRGRGGSDFGWISSPASHAFPFGSSDALGRLNMSSNRPQHYSQAHTHNAQSAYGGIAGGHPLMNSDAYLKYLHDTEDADNDWTDMAEDDELCRRKGKKPDDGPPPDAPAYGMAGLYGYDVGGDVGGSGGGGGGGAAGSGGESGGCAAPLESEPQGAYVNLLQVAPTNKHPRPPQYRPVLPLTPPPPPSLCALPQNPERYTGYAGPSAARVWRAIQQENCFGGLNDTCLEKRVFYRLMSGLQARAPRPRSLPHHLTSPHLTSTTHPLTVQPLRPPPPRHACRRRFPRSSPASTTTRRGGGGPTSPCSCAPWGRTRTA